MAGHIKYVNPKQRKRARRKVSIRLKLSGTAERPRLSVFRSARYVYAQAIDDSTGRVVAAASELEETLKTAVAGKPKKERARAIYAKARPRYHPVSSGTIDKILADSSSR